MPSGSAVQMCPRTDPNVSEADRKFAEQEYRAFYHCLAYTLETMPVFCINKFSAARFLHNKAVQLQLAQACGLRIPATLLSNSPGRIREFVVQNPHRTIGKGFSPHVWQRSDEDGVSVTETFKLTPELLPSDEVLTYAPGIYQERVDKQFDIRMVIMGRRVYSFALRNPKKALDWRQDAGYRHVTVETISTPPEVGKGILEFAQKANICFGSVDFAVDNEDIGGFWKSMSKDSSCGWTSSTFKPGRWRNLAHLSPRRKDLHSHWKNGWGSSSFFRFHHALQESAGKSGAD